MKQRNKILIALGIVLAIIASLFLVTRFVGADDFEINQEHLSVFEDDHSVYYLRKAPQDLGFKVLLSEPGESLDYQLTDEAGNDVEARVKQMTDNTYEIRAPKTGYGEGERFELTLGQGAFFKNEGLLDAKTLIFAVERGPIEHYELTDEVIELDQTIVQISPDTIEVQGSDLQTDTIIFGQDEDEAYVVYKIDEVISPTSAKVTLPALDEIYSELEVYGEYDFDFHDIVANPDIEATLVSAMKNSPFYASLLSTAYAEEKDAGEADLALEYTVDTRTNALQIKAVITLKAGKDGLFGRKQLKHHEVQITLISDLAMTANIDVDGVVNWDVSATRSEGFAWEVDVTYQPPKIDHSSKLTDLFEEDNESEIITITRLLNEVMSDELKNEILLFEHGIPIMGIPGLVVTCEIHIALSLELQANLNFQNDYTTVTTVGLIYRDRAFNPYYTTDYETSGGEATMKGKIKSKAGMSFAIKTKLFHDKIAYISLTPEVGLYADAYVAITLKSFALDKDHTYGYFESGTYFKAKVEGYINTLFNQHDLYDEIEEVRQRFELLSFGDYKIIAGLDTEKTTLYAKDFLALPADFTFDYYDIRSEEEVNKTISAADITYLLEDGTEVLFQDRALVIPKTDKAEVIVTATYKDDSRKTYSKDLTIYISENRPGGFIDHADFAEPMVMTFSSGAGAWRTVIELASDGSFTGLYEDANAGMSGNGYFSTNYISEFTGWFDEIERLDEETYAMTLIELDYHHEMDKEWIEEQIKYVASDAYGFEEGKEFYLYSPQKDQEGLTDDFLSWGASATYPDNQLGHWGLHNIDPDYGFFSQNYLEEMEEPLVDTTEWMPTSFINVTFDHEYDGPGSEFIGVWEPVHNATVDLGAIKWVINYHRRSDTYYLHAVLPGASNVIRMTAKYKDGALYSTNGTPLHLLDFENPDTQRIELPETVPVGSERSTFFFEDGYLQWTSEDREDDRQYLLPGEYFKGYEQQ